MRKSAIFFFAFLIFFIFTAPLAKADYRARVLGAKTVNLQIPPTVEGPGFVLPDSPLYFLDTLKQNARILLAFTPEEKAKVHADIAGERLAELRFMLSKNNKAGAEKALSGVSENFQKAAEGIEEAKLSGKDVSGLAKEINDSIRIKQQALDVLEEKAQGELKQKVSAAQEGLLFAKVKAEEGLSPKDLQNEIDYDLDWQISRKVWQSSQLSENVEEDLKDLVREASQAAERSLINREAAIKQAIEIKNQDLQKEREQLLELEKLKNMKLMELEADEAKQVMETVRNAKEAAKKYQNVRKSMQEIRNVEAGVSAVPKMTPTPSPIP